MRGPSCKTSIIFGDNTSVFSYKNFNAVLTCYGLTFTTHQHM